MRLIVGRTRVAVIMLMLLTAWLTIFLINIVPFFMPPTLALLACFRVRFDLPVWLLAPAVALVAGAGAADRLGPLFFRQFGGRVAFIGPLTAAVMVIALVKIDWQSVLRRWTSGRMIKASDATEDARP